jgi:hypothetical protein
MFSALHLELGHCSTQPACLKLANKRLVHRSNLTGYSITSSARARSAPGAPGVNFCNPIKIDESRFIHLVAGCLNLRELELSALAK